MGKQNETLAIKLAACLDRLDDLGGEIAELLEAADTTSAHRLIWETRIKVWRGQLLDDFKDAP